MKQLVIIDTESIFPYNLPDHMGQILIPIGLFWIVAIWGLGHNRPLPLIGALEDQKCQLKWIFCARCLFFPL